MSATEKVRNEAETPELLSLCEFILSGLVTAAISYHKWSYSSHSSYTFYDWWSQILYTKLPSFCRKMLNHALYDSHILPTASPEQYHGQTYLDITYNTVMKCKTTSDLDFTKYNPYLTVKHQLYGIYYDLF